MPSDHIYCFFFNIKPTIYFAKKSIPFFLSRRIRRSHWIMLRNAELKRRSLKCLGQFLASNQSPSNSTLTPLTKTRAQTTPIYLKMTKKISFNEFISYLRTLGNLEWIDFLVFDHKVEFGYSFGGQMTPDQ